jgi:hypothetical protein
MPLTLVYGDQRHHRVAVSAEHHRLDVTHRAVERLGQEGTVARRVEHAGHAEHALAREAGGFLRDVAHHVERIADDDDDRVGRRVLDLLTDRLTMPAFVLSRSSRDMPGLRAMPAVMMTMSESFVSS